jgi:hypothetical protein
MWQRLSGIVVDDRKIANGMCTSAIPYFAAGLVFVGMSLGYIPIRRGTCLTASRVCTPREAEDEPDGLEAEFLLPRGEAIPVPIQFELGTAADHMSSCIDTHIRQDNRWGVLVVELYSGCGNHSRHVARALRQVLYVQEGDNFRLRRGPVGEVTAKRRPPVVVLSIDRKAHPAGTSLVVDARGLTAENLGKLKAKMPNMVVILLASPPCIAYSTVNTTGVRDLELADDLVRVVQACHETLGPVCTIMENPAAPGLLSERVSAH